MKCGISAISVGCQCILIIIRFLKMLTKRVKRVKRVKVTQKTRRKKGSGKTPINKLPTDPKFYNNNKYDPKYIDRKRREIKEREEHAKELKKLHKVFRDDELETIGYEYLEKTSN